MGGRPSHDSPLVPSMWLYSRTLRSQLHLLTNLCACPFRQTVVSHEPFVRAHGSLGCDDIFNVHAFRLALLLDLLGELCMIFSIFSSLRRHISNAIFEAWFSLSLLFVILFFFSVYNLGFALVRVHDGCLVCKQFLVRL